MTPFILSQILALGTLVAGMIAFQFRDRQQVLRGWFVAAVFGAAHFWFLGAYEACFLVSITAARFLVSSFTTDRRIMFAFLALAVAGFALTYQSPVSLLALAATLIGTVGAFYGTGNAVRYAMMAAELLWMVHNLIIWSPVAVIMEVLFFTSNVIGLIRHRQAGPAPL